jgi:transcriptional regulator with XRE-family HTH domain
MQLDLEGMTAGRRLRVLRVAAGLKVWELATRSGVHQGRISELENDRRAGTADEWARLQAVLGTTDDGPDAV